MDWPFRGFLDVRAFSAKAPATVTLCSCVCLPPLVAAAGSPHQITSHTFVSVLSYKKSNSAPRDATADNDSHDSDSQAVADRQLVELGTWLLSLAESLSRSLWDSVLFLASPEFG